jgi:hypothetical protein
LKSMLSRPCAAITVSTTSAQFCSDVTKRCM